MNINKVLSTASFAGQIILESGGETYRVEDTIMRIAKSYGLIDPESYVTPTGIICSASNEKNETISIVKRVKNRSVNLERIDLVNDVSRKLQNEPMDINDLYDELVSISKSRRYPISLDIFCSSFAAAGFSILFGGNMKDFACAFLIGVVIKLLVNFFGSLEINQFFINSICGAVSAFLAIIFSVVIPDTNIDMIIIGSIMLLVPGLSITNAVRDTISGDLVSGLTRAADAFLVAVSIAAGTGIVLSFWSKYLGGVLS